MAQIGTFTRDENGAYAGTSKILALNVKAIIKPCDRDNDKAPDYRVPANGVDYAERCEGIGDFPTFFGCCAPHNIEAEGTAPSRARRR